MRVKIFQPFQKVWTPRTPDSGYSSFGPSPPNPIVLTPLKTETLGHSLTLGSISYYVGVMFVSQQETLNDSVRFASGQYIPASVTEAEPIGSQVAFGNATYTP